MRRKNDQWAVIASNLVPDYRVVTSFRRITNQQLGPLRDLKVELTPDVIDKYKWDAFWDAPLNMDAPPARGGDAPPAADVMNQPGLRRKPEEIMRAGATCQVTSCSATTDGSRIEVSFPYSSVRPAQSPMHIQW